MASLDRHTLSPRLEEHAKLPFRADCPFCRQVRLRGPLPSPEIVPRRAKAGLLAGMLAATGAAPAAPALAQPPPSNAQEEAAVLPPGGIEADDTGREGDPPAVELGGAPEQAGPPVTGPRPEIRPPKAPIAQPVDPGGASAETREPSEAPTPEVHAEEAGPAPAPEPPRQEPEAEEPRPALSEGATEQSAPRREPASGSEPEQQLNPPPSRAEPRERAPEPQQAPTPEVYAQEPAPAPAPAQGRHELQDEGTRPAPPEGESEQAAPLIERERGSEPEREIDGSGGSEADESHRSDGAGGARPMREPASGERDGVGGGAGSKRSDASVSAAPEHVVRAEAGPVHVVKPGESLWGIAEGRLGARASDAEIAKEVNRLWEVNDTEVIKTGDPNLILPGQRLLL
jgi:LysM repeat protein